MTQPTHRMEVCYGELRVFYEPDLRPNPFYFMWSEPT